MNELTQSTPKKPKRAAPKQRLPFGQWRQPFIDALREFGVVSYAAEIAGVDRAAVYRARERNQRFAAEWEDALAEATDTLEREARRRAVDGVQRLKFHQGYPIMVPLLGENGRPVLEDAVDQAGNPILDKEGNPKQTPVMVPYVEHEYSDTLLIFLLKNWNKEKYGDKMQLSTPDGRPLVSQTVNNFANVSDDELYDAVAAAMGQIAAPPERESDGGGDGTGAPAAGTDADPAAAG